METDQDIVNTDDHVTVALDIDKAADDMDNIHLRDEEKGDEVGVPVATDKDTSKINWAADVSAEYRLNKTTASEKDLETRSAGSTDQANIVATCATESESQAEEHVKNVAEAWQTLYSSSKAVSQGQYTKDFLPLDEKVTRSGYKANIGPIQQLDDKKSSESPFLAQAGLKSYSKRAEIWDRRNKDRMGLLRDRRKVLLEHRKKSQPLVDIDEALRGKMFSNPVVEPPLLQDVSNVLKKVLDQQVHFYQNQGTHGDTVPKRRQFMAANVNRVITQAADDLMPVAATLKDTINRTILIKIGTSPKSPHLLKYFDSVKKSWVKMTPRTAGSVENWSKTVLQMLLQVAQAYRKKLPDWLAVLASIVGIDTENYLNVDDSKCQTCHNKDVHCTKTKLERIHFYIGEYYVTILTPGQKPTKVNPKFGKFVAPDWVTEGVYTCQVTSYTKEGLAPLVRFLGAAGPFVLAGFDVEQERKGIMEFADAIGIAEAIGVDLNQGFEINFIEGDAFKNELRHLVQLPGNPGGPRVQGCTFQQLWFTGSAPPARVWLIHTQLGQADWSELSNKSPVELWMSYLYHRADAAFPRLSCALAITLSILQSGATESNQKDAAKIFSFTLLEKMCRDHSNKHWKIFCHLPDVCELMDWFKVPTLPPSMKDTYTWEDPGAYIAKFQPKNFETLSTNVFVTGLVPRGEAPGPDVEMTSPGPQAPSDLDKTADSMPLSLSTRSDSSKYELAANLVMPMDMEQAEVLQHLETLVAEDGKFPRDIAVGAMQYVNERIRMDARRKLEEAKRRMEAELQEKLEELTSNESRAAGDEKALQEEIKSSATLVNQLQEQVKRCRLDIKQAIEDRESARSETQLAKARHKSSLQSVIEHIGGEVKEGWAHLHKFVSDNAVSMAAVLRESEAATPPPPPICNRPFSERENRKVIYPDLPAPTFLMEGEMPEWLEMVKYRFHCWSEVKRITAVLTDPTVVHLMESIKGRANMGGLFGAWSRATAGEQWDWMRWRDIKIVHMGWQRLCHPMAARIPTGVKAIKESHAELQQVDNTINTVCQSLFGVRAEPVWTHHGLLDPQLNTAEQASARDVSTNDWDEEIMKWIKGCTYSETELDDDAVLVCKEQTPVTQTTDKTPTGGSRPGKYSQGSARATHRASASPISRRPQDDDEVEIIGERRRRVSTNRARLDSSEERYMMLNTPYLPSSTPKKRSAAVMSGRHSNSSRYEDEHQGQHSRDSSISSRGGYGKKRGGPQQGAQRGGFGSQRSQYVRGLKRGRGKKYSRRGGSETAPQQKQSRYR